MIYGPDLHAEVLRYAEEAARIAARETFDVIHAHDWLTFMAGMRREAGQRQAPGPPRPRHRVRPLGRRRERLRDRRSSAPASPPADRVVAVSGYTADVLATRYGVPRERLRVVHNAIDAREPDGALVTIGEEDPLVLFAGRITWQKGPDYFVDAAARVAAEMPDVKFAVAGAGDRLRRHDAARRRARARGPVPVHRVSCLRTPSTGSMRGPTSTSCRPCPSRSA